MSDWALELVREQYHRNEYRVHPKYMRAFKASREAAIPALISAVEYRHSKARILWFRFTQRLPASLGKRLQPKMTYTANRWAGVLALSNLAREEPDPRITDFLLKCMEHESPTVRKVAAYEAGPWLDPVHPERAIEILRLALFDPAAAVQRDACRRIAASATPANPAYRKAAQKLLPELRALDPKKIADSQRAITAVTN